MFEHYCSKCGKQIKGGFKMLYGKLNFKERLVKITLDDNSIIKGTYKGYEDDEILEVEQVQYITANNKVETYKNFIVYKDEIVKMQNL